MNDLTGKMLELVQGPMRVRKYKRAIKVGGADYAVKRATQLAVKIANERQKSGKLSELKKKLYKKDVDDLRKAVQSRITDHNISAVAKQRMEQALNMVSDIIAGRTISKEDYEAMVQTLQELDVSSE